MTGQGYQVEVRVEKTRLGRALLIISLAAGGIFLISLVFSLIRGFDSTKVVAFLLGFGAIVMYAAGEMVRIRGLRGEARFEDGRLYISRTRPWWKTALLYGAREWRLFVVAVNSAPDGAIEARAHPTDPRKALREQATYRVSFRDLAPDERDQLLKRLERQARRSAARSQRQAQHIANKEE